MTERKRTGASDQPSSDSTSRCFHCGRSVQPTPEGYCPSCTRPFRPAIEGQQEFEVSPPVGTSTSPTATLMIKVALVIFAFPALAWIIRILCALVLTLPWLLMPEPPRASTLTVLSIVSQIVGLGGAFLICRRFWPKEPSAPQY